MTENTTSIGAEHGSASGAQTVERAFRVLSCFGAGGSLGVSEIARQLSLSISTTHRSLRSLVAAGMLEQDVETSRYRLGTGVVAWHHMVAQDRGYATAEPLLWQLALDTGGATALGVRDRGRVLVPASRTPAANTSRTAFAMPLHASALGKVLLAHSPDRLGDIAALSPFERFTEHTITEPEALLADLEKTRQTGYAVADREAQADQLAVAAPVFSAAGLVTMSISVRIPWTPEASWRIPRLGQMTVDVAALLQQQLEVAAANDSGGAIS